jgi:hypothetical protein
MEISGGALLQTLWEKSELLTMNQQLKTAHSITFLTWGVSKNG